MHLSPEEKKKLLSRLRRAEGQLAAIVRMVESDADCVPTLTQVSAVRGALGRAGEVMLRHHIETCVTAALRSGDETARAQRIDEVMAAVARGVGRSG